MPAIGVPSAVFLLYMLVLLPWVSFRSAGILNAPPDSRDALRTPPRARMYVNTTIMLCGLFLLAWFTARSSAYDVFQAPRLGSGALLAGLGALAFCVGTTFAYRAIRSPEELRRMPVNRLMPTTPRERALYSLSAVVAGVAEEAAYRGVLTSILWHALGNPWVAVAIAATAFALGHALQGWKSMIVIFVLALAMHALVWFTGTLVISMAVHAVYDLLAPTIRRRIVPAPPRDRERSAG